MDDSAPPRRSGASLLAFGCLTPLVLYGVGYIYLRLSHELINYGHFIAGPNALHRHISVSITELVYAPLIMLEVFIRDL